jgi:PLP dependent protein
MNRAEARSRLKDNLDAVEARIQNACRRAGRARDSVLLIAVTKYVDCETAALLPEFGVLNLGESRPQELWRKAAELPKDIFWHLIGHLQRNKIERTLPLAALIHSVDSDRLLEAISTEAQKTHRTVNVLLEVNLSREQNKTGFDAKSVPLANASDEWRFPGVNPLGLMTMAAAADDPEQSRATFAELRALRDRIRLTTPSVRELSMGMTHDFEVAIEEGATMARIGSALFEGIIETDGEQHPR